MAGPQHSTPEWAEASRAYRIASRLFRAPVRGLSRLRTQGLDNVPGTGAAILVSNHLSIVDPILISGVIPRPTYWLAKEALFHNKVSALGMRAFGCIKVDRQVGGNEDAVSTAVRALDEGKAVGIFPEGTRSRPGEVRRGKTGVARIAALSGAPVIPLALDTSDFWPRHARAPRVGAKVYMAIGEPVKLTLSPDDASDKKRLREATDDIMTSVRDLLATAQRAKEDNAPW